MNQDFTTLFLALATNELTDSTLAVVPGLSRGAWFPASGWRSPDTSSLHFFAERVGNSTVNLLCRSLGVLHDSGLPLCSMKRLSFARVSTGDDDQQNLLHEACDADSFVVSEDAMVRGQRDLRAIMDKVIRKTLGFFRSMRPEKVDKKIITLSFETCSPRSEIGVLLIASTIKAAFETASPESEYRKAYN
ncbi:hypothetical protein F5Y12DRAFT_712134 [Xylaria sp. FL1777]|nr:hypothetical protein F5Y12DRAFT_712134 [Xylaria sp. FL1777]